MLDKTYTLATVGNLCAISYGVAILAAIILLLVAIFLIGGIVAGGGDNGVKAAVRSRRSVFWALSFVAPVLTACLNFLIFAGHVVGKPAQDKYFTANLASIGVAFALYILVGFIFSKTLFKDKNLATVFKSPV